MTLRNLVPALGRKNVSPSENYRPLSLFNEDCERAFDSFFRGFEIGSFLSDDRSLRPNLKFSENEKEIKVTAELPGMGEDDVECTLSGNMLTVKGEKQEEKEEEKKGFYLKERHYGSFMRNFTLPENVDTDKLEAEVSDGVLRVFMPKCEKKQKSRKIEVKKS